MLLAHKFSSLKLLAIMTLPATHLFFEDFFFEDFFFGTLPPSFRASDNPIAIACFLLVTFLPDRPLLSVPSFLSCIAFSTLSEAFLPYLAITLFLLPVVLDQHRASFAQGE